MAWPGGSVCRPLFRARRPHGRNRLGISMGHTLLHSPQAVQFIQIDKARFFPQRGREVAGVRRSTCFTSVRVIQFNVEMSAGLHQFGRDDTHGAVVGGEGLVQLGHDLPPMADSLFYEDRPCIRIQPDPGRLEYRQCRRRPPCTAPVVGVVMLSSSVVAHKCHLMARAGVLGLLSSSTVRCNAFGSINPAALARTKTYPLRTTTGNPPIPQSGILTSEFRVPIPRSPGPEDRCPIPYQSFQAPLTLSLSPNRGEGTLSPTWGTGLRFLVLSLWFAFTVPGSHLPIP
jgi:mRNA-degrading endonuclease toxin of MazEF toxin-antitoxin module